MTRPQERHSTVRWNCNTLIVLNLFIHKSNCTTIEAYASTTFEGSRRELSTTRPTVFKQYSNYTLEAKFNYIKIKRWSPSLRREVWTHLYFFVLFYFFETLLFCFIPHKTLSAHLLCLNLQDRQHQAFCWSGIFLLQKALSDQRSRQYHFL